MKYEMKDFSLKKREKLLDYKHYSTNFDELMEALTIVDETLAEPEDVLAAIPPIDLMDPTQVRADLMTEFLSTCYSAGHELPYLRSLYPPLVKYWETYAKYSRAFNESTSPPTHVAHIALSDTAYHTAMRLVSWGILLGCETLIPRLLPILDYNNRQRDGLLERLLAPYTGERGTLPNECLRHLPYFKLLKVFSASREERSTLISEYLEEWYPASRREPYYESHKRGASFTGYWSWEAAAVTLVLNIDDSSYRHAPFYPSDMVEFSRQSKTLYAPAGMLPATSNELRSKAGDPCPLAGLWQSLDVTAKSQRYQQGQPMDDLESAYGLTVWRFIAT